jgi:hypothetical protein
MKRNLRKDTVDKAQANCQLPLDEVSLRSFARRGIRLEIRTS